VSWDEVDGVEAANMFSLGEAAARAQGPDPWPDYFKVTQSITKAMLSSVAGDKL
jgi:bifunctional non-homologous end joining protein LigD